MYEMVLEFSDGDNMDVLQSCSGDYSIHSYLTCVGCTEFTSTRLFSCLYSGHKTPLSHLLLVVPSKIYIDLDHELNI